MEDFSSQMVPLDRSSSGNDTVRVGKLPGEINEVFVPQESTIVEVLARVDLTAEGYEIRLNGSPADLNERVTPGDTVLLVRKIRGACS